MAVRQNPNQQQLPINDTTTERENTSAVEALTQQLKRLNDYYDAQQQKTRTKQADRDDPWNAPAGAPVVSPYRGDPLKDRYASSKADRAKYGPNGTEVGGTGQLGRLDNLRAARDTLNQLGEIRRTSMNPQRGGGVSPAGSVPSSVGGRPMGQSSAPEENEMSMGQAMTMEMLKGHGGPSFIRNAALGSYSLQQQLKWARGNSMDNPTVNNALTNGFAVPFTGGRINIPGIGQGAMDTINGALTTAIENPLATYAGYKAVTGAVSGAASLAQNLNDYTDMGYNLGYGGSSNPGFLGMRNPLNLLSGAQQEGAAANTSAIQNGLLGSLTSGQASADTSAIMGQGFSYSPLSTFNSLVASVPGVGEMLSGLFTGKGSGDANRIQDQLVTPLQNKYPSLSGDTIMGFTDALRNSGESIQTLKDTLSDLGAEAKTTKESVGQYAQALQNLQETFTSMGSSSQGAVQAGTNFTASTGLDPQILGTLAQNPMFQGLMLGQGILPSGIGDADPGQLSSTSTQLVQMLAGGLKGLDYNTYNKYGEITRNGKQQQVDQIAQMTGLPANIVTRMLGDAKGNNARSALDASLGAAGSGKPGSGTGFWSLIDAGKSGKDNDRLSNSQYKNAEAAWKSEFANNWQNTGISHKDMERIGNIKNMRNRAKALQDAMTKASGNDAWNKIDSSGGNSVTIGLTAQAAKALKIAGGTSGNKKISNAGGSSINIAVNSTTGDLSAMGDSFNTADGHFAK